MKPDDWVVRDQIALARSDRGDWAAAVEEQRESVRRFPGLAVVHKALAHALEGAGRTDDAIAEFREAVRLEPRFPSAYLYLGRALIEAGDYRAALEASGTRRPRPSAPGPEHQRIDAGVASGAPDRAGAAAVRRRERDATAPPTRKRSRNSPGSPSPGTSTWRRPACGADAFAASPALAADPTSGNRFQASTSRGAGRCRGRPTRGRARRRLSARWREQAVAWLEADLAASAAVLESGTARQRAAVSKRLGRWQVDPALAGLRDVQAVAGIPEPERRSLRDLWCRIDALRTKAGASAPQAHGKSRNP